MRIRLLARIVSVICMAIMLIPLTLASIVAYAVLDRTMRIGQFPLGLLALFAAPAALFMISSMVARRQSWGS